MTPTQKNIIFQEQPLKNYHTNLEKSTLILTKITPPKKKSSHISKHTQPQVVVAYPRLESEGCKARIKAVSLLQTGGERFLLRAVPPEAEEGK